MKKAVLTGPRQLTMKDADIPKPKPGEVVMRVDYCGICGSDLDMWKSGTVYGNIHDIVLGHEFSGKIYDAGDSDYKVGDRILFFYDPCMECEQCKLGDYNLCSSLMSRGMPGTTMDGGYAQYCVGKARTVYKLPDSISDVAAAMIEPTTVSYRAVRRGNITLGDKVLVIGAGIIGQIAGALARKSGAKYVALSEINANRLAVAKNLGEFDDYSIDGGGIKFHSFFDVVYECAGAKSGMDAAIMAVKPGHVIVAVGPQMEGVSPLFSMILPKEITITGTMSCNAPGELNDVIDMIAKGEFDPVKFLADIVPLDKIQETFERLTSGKDKSIKTVIQCNKEQ